MDWSVLDNTNRIRRGFDAWCRSQWERSLYWPRSSSDTTPHGHFTNDDYYCYHYCLNSIGRTGAVVGGAQGSYCRSKVAIVGRMSSPPPPTHTPRRRRTMNGGRWREGGRRILSVRLSLLRRRKIEESCIRFVQQARRPNNVVNRSEERREERENSGAADPLSLTYRRSFLWWECVSLAVSRRHWSIDSDMNEWIAVLTGLWLCVAQSDG